MDWSPLRTDWAVWFLWEKAEGTATMVPVLSPSTTQSTDADFLGSSTFLHSALAWRKALAPPSQLPVAPPAKLSPPEESAA